MRVKSRQTRLWAFAVSVVVVAAGLVATTTPAQALSGAEFDPGHIISDAAFYDANAMSQPEIQSFLERMAPGACGPFSCLKNYRMTTSDRAQYYSNSSGQVECQFYKGAANELASTIIFRVQQACGISAKVILVTLQKERSLVTKTSPTGDDFRAAMGYACPDSSACNTVYYGLFNQIRSASEQFKRYKVAPGDFGYRAGRVNYIQQKPFTDCPVVAVNIRNQATAGLYNYTPYVPNAAALANLSGLGDGCSSYGNRNFWVFYNTWFGDSAGSTAGYDMDALYQQNGGATGAFGTLVTESACAPAAPFCWRDYQAAFVYWTKSLGAVPTTGAILTAYRATGGPTGTLGLPSTAVVTYPSPPGRSAQSFAGTSTIYSSPPGTFIVRGAVRSAYFNAGGEGGLLGWPISAETCVGAGCTQVFEGGTVYPSATGALAVPTAIDTAYRAAGGPTGSLGFPSTDFYLYPSLPGRIAQSFAGGGSMYASPAGTFIVQGTTRAAYFKAGGEGGSLGWPVSAEVCTGTNCSQVFEGGSIHSSATAGFVVPAVINAAYLAAGGSSGSLGAPTSGVFTYPALPGRVAQIFAGSASIYASPAGAFVVRGATRTAYFAAGGEGGVIGWPIAAEVCAAANCSQKFEGGTVYASPAGGVAVRAAIDVAYASAGGLWGSLGNPTSDVYLYPALPGRMAQSFAGGASIYASPAGSFVVRGAMRNAYFSAGGEGGSLGWPIAAEVCAAANCSQRFEGGTVYTSPAGAVTVRAAIDIVYAAAGGPWGSLGAPTSGVFTYSALPGRIAQIFGSASIYASPAGSFVVRDAMRNAYFSAGGEGGSLGWPIAAEVCAAANCSQRFEGGTVYSSPAGGVTVRAAIDVAYAAAGGPWGSLGNPTSDVYLYPSLPGRMAQLFGGASIYASSAGSFVVRGVMRNAYFAAGGEGGSLGWPIAVEVCDGATDRCSQAFERGTVATP